MWIAQEVPTTECKTNTLKPAKQVKRKQGQPTKYTEELADKICELIASSNNGVHVISQELKIAPSSVFLWLSTHKYFSDKYTRAREVQAELLADEIIQIADDGTNDYMTITKGDHEYNVEDKEVTNRSKLRVDARKWKASKLAPKKYGDKLELEHKGEIKTISETTIFTTKTKK